ILARAFENALVSDAGRRLPEVLALAVRRPDPELGFLPAYAEVRHQREAASFARTLAAVRGRLETILSRDRAGRAALTLLAGGELPAAMLPLTPAVWRLLERMGAADEAADPATRGVLLSLGMALKRSELVMALRRRVARVATPGPAPVLTDRRPPVALAPTIRPFDFARPGVVDSAVRRFGLIYDLVSFTTELEEVRKAGRAAEERALRFMFAFQSGLADIAARYRLQFEKHLGDGAFYSARRALRVVGAACEILLRYDALRERGFPFTRGIRMAANFATYHLVPMPSPDAGGVRYEFFGHGIVELARLTTGKAEREIEEMAEFLLHAGYDPGEVDRFL
ncbi:MAG: hypothetical protein D6739_08775, partial [Nitrospirae bacterium]